nr:unnamed protein product [Digitaria exilis]
MRRASSSFTTTELLNSHAAGAARRATSDGRPASGDRWPCLTARDVESPTAGGLHADCRDRCFGFRCWREKDDKIIVVCTDDTEYRYRHYNDLSELSPHRVEEIR